MYSLPDDLIELESKVSSLSGEEASDEMPVALHGVIRARLPSSTEKFIRDAKHEDGEEAYEDEKDFIDDYIDIKYPISRRIRKFSLKLFRNPISCVTVIILMVILNLLIYSEDPMTYSEKEVKMHGFGRIYNYFFRQYPPVSEVFWICFKVFSLTLWILLGGLIGKYVVHDVFLRDCLNLGLFKKDMGSWTIMIFTSCFTIFLGSFVYNAIVSNHFHVKDGSDNSDYILNDYLGIREITFNLIAVIITLYCYLITLLITVDVMVQASRTNEKRSIKYGCNSSIADFLQTKWQYWRKLVFLVCFLFSNIGLFFYLAFVYRYGWVVRGAGHFSWTEVSRAWLCAFIVLFDLILFMQDWDYPKFKKGNNNVQMMGCGGTRRGCRNKKCLSLKITFNAKWVNYGPWFIMTLLNCNLFLNQYTYIPLDYMQITDERGYIRNINEETDMTIFLNGSVYNDFSDTKKVTINKLHLQKIYNSNCNETLKYGDTNADDFYDEPPWCTLCVREIGLNDTQNNFSNISTSSTKQIVRPGENITKCYNVSMRFDIKFVEAGDEEKLISLLPVVIIFIVFYGIIIASVYNNSKCRCLKKISSIPRYEVTS